MPVAAAPESVRFNRDIRPILVEKCHACHGPDVKDRKSKLRLDSFDAATRDLGNRRAVVAGNPAGSELIRRIHSSDPDEVMPPPDAAKQLSPRDRRLLKDWIEQGARWERHWAFIAPQQPSLPVVTNTAWPVGPIDRFVLARLEAGGVAPSPEADRRTLLRRLSFDLTGLPPYAREIDAFVRDPTPQAYDRQVVRLINSPQFGERMAMHWLDLVRYADTDGYHADNPRPVWLYRNYVINAFNANTPFDAFTLHQLAGDLLPDPDDGTRIASGYNMLIKTTEEGGATEAEYRLRYASDRVRTTASVWLGLTLMCAECHDHKSDPLAMRDFYSFSAFFADIDEPGVGKRRETALPSVQQSAQLEALTARLDRAIEHLETLKQAAMPQRDSAVQELQAAHRTGRRGWKPVSYHRFAGGNERRFETRLDGSILVRGPERQDDYTIEISTPLEEVRALRLEVLRDPAVVLELERQGIGYSYILSEIEVEVIQPGQPPRRVPIDLAFADINAHNFLAAHAIDGRPETAWAVGSDIRAPATRIMFRLAERVAVGPNTRFLVRLKNSSQYPHMNIRHFRLSVSSAADASLFPDDHALPHEVAEVLSRPAASWGTNDQSALTEFFVWSQPEIRPVDEAAKQLAKERDAMIKQFPATLISKAGSPRVTRILPRGNWMDESGAVVQPAVPALFGSRPHPTNRLTRLDLAQWLVSRDNPLTARVFVNRLWKLFFGTGLVTTPADFGVAGGSPSHPELLDHLALQFMESGWNVKQLVAAIVSSRAYRQTSTGRPDLEARDPQNRLFARQGRWRLDAEMIRDNSLFVAGMMVTNIGGPSAFPYQPAGYLEHLDFPKRTYEATSGYAQYRRGLYTFWQRSFLNPALALFDAPSREECVAERPVSNTPLQALALLNNPSQVEAARVLAMETLMGGNRPPAHRVASIFRHVLGRPPDPEETVQLVQLYERQRDRLQGRSEDARALNAVGQAPLLQGMAQEDVAAWTAVTRAVLNLHETITRY